MLFYKGTFCPIRGFPLQKFMFVGAKMFECVALQFMVYMYVIIGIFRNYNDSKQNTALISETYFALSTHFLRENYSS